MAQNKESKPGIRTYNQFAAALKNGEEKSIYLFFGNEEYLMEKAVKALTKKYLSAGCEELDCHEMNWDHKTMNPDRLYELFSTPPFMSQKRIIVLYNSEILFGKSNDTSGTWESYFAILNRITQMSCVIFVETKIDKRKKSLIESFLKMGSIVQVDKQRPEDLCRWVSMLLNRQNIRITIDAVNSLIDRMELDMRALENEVEKLILYCQYNHVQELGINEIDLICIPDLRGSIFQMTDAIGERNFHTALQILDRLVALREPVTKIRFMLARHLRQLICAKESGQAAQLASAMKMSPYIAQKLVKQARLFQLEKLIELYVSYSESDYRIRTGQMEERIALDIFLCSFSP